MEVYFLRHGEAGKRMALAAKDGERALTAAGREEMKEVGDAMADIGFKFDVIATSPLRRAKETAAVVNKALKRKSPLEEWPELKPEGDRAMLYSRLGKLKAGSSVLCVGHEPYLTTAIGELTSRGDGGTGFRIVLKKGGLARLSVTGLGPRPAAELRWLLTPKQIRKMA